MPIPYTERIEALDAAVSALLGALGPWNDREAPRELGQLSADHLSTTVRKLAGFTEEVAGRAADTVSTSEGPATLHLWDVAIIAECVLSGAEADQDIGAFHALYDILDRAHADASKEWERKGAPAEGRAQEPQPSAEPEASEASPRSVTSGNGPSEPPALGDRFQQVGLIEHHGGLLVSTADALQAVGFGDSEIIALLKRRVTAAAMLLWAIEQGKPAHAR